MRQWVHQPGEPFMREAKDMPDNPQPEPQTVGKCAELQRACQGKIFDHVDEQHQKVMEGIGEIKEQLAYQKGQANGRDTSKQPPVSGKRWSWREVAAVIVIGTSMLAAAVAAVRSEMAQARITAAIKNVNKGP